MNPKRILIALVLICLILCTVYPAAAVQGTPSQNLGWWSMDAGGAIASSNGIYTLDGTIGQPDAAIMIGNHYVLAGGFWAGKRFEYFVYLPVLRR
jgi:hypothetical protein